MKFSTFAGVATLFSGVLAAPHGSSAVADAVHVKRTDLTSVVTAIENEATSVIAVADSINQLIEKGIAGDASLIANITTSLLDINGTLTNIEDLLADIGLGTANVVTDAASALNGLISGILGGVSTKAATSAASTISTLEDAAGVSSALSKVVSAVSSTVASVTSAVKSGSLGSTTDLSVELNGLLSTASLVLKVVLSL